MRRGTAHILFASGGLIVPARTAYERQLLREHVLASVHHRQQVQVSLGRHAWLVTQATPEHTVVCTSCDRQINHAVCHQVGSSAASCVVCALQ